MYITPFENRKIARKSRLVQVAPAKPSPNGKPSSLREMSYDSPVLNPASTFAGPPRELADQVKRINWSLAEKPHPSVTRVMILGIRGFPNVQGGAEKHVENLAHALSQLGCSVEAIVRSDFVPTGTRQWHKIKIVRIWNSRTKGVETFFHTFCGVLYAAWRRPDILHIHGIGPAIFTPLARALGLRVVVTYHSLNYEHAKWGYFARLLLRTGEWAGIKFSRGQIAVSDRLAKLMNKKYNAHVIPIPNGLAKPEHINTTRVIDAFGLSPGGYALIVARIDQAKRQLDLINAYSRIDSPKFKLAVVGQADHVGEYTRAVAEVARKTPGVVMLGQQNGEVTG